MSEVSKSVEVFCSYAREDKASLRKLEKALSQLKQQGLITTWNDRLIPAGTNQAQAIDTHLETASVILLLISADFLASDYHYGIEMRRALERQNHGEACVIPVILRPCDWKGAPFGKLQALPTDARPIAKWDNHDEAFLDVVMGMRKAIEDLTSPIGTRSTTRSIWHVPYQRNQFFTGRGTVIKELHEMLTTGRATGSERPQALSGESGIGKTQIALEYAYCYKDEYRAVLWAKANSLEILMSDLVSTADALNLPEKSDSDQGRVVKAVKQWLQSHQSWLLILDSIEDKDVEKIYNFLLQECRGDILLTTRTQIVEENVVNLFLIDPMDKEEGIALILQRANILKAKEPITRASEQDQIEAGAIVNEMGGLPLALEQAGAYIKETGCGLAGYLDSYRKHRPELLKQWGKGPDHPEFVAKAWSLSFHKVRQENKAAADLLRFFSFLNPDAIPEEMIISGAHELGPALQSIARDSFDLNNKAIRELQRFSLVRRNTKTKPPTFSIHRLVQQVLRDGMDSNTQRLWVERTIRAINQAFPNVEYATWFQCQQYLPHVLVCIPYIEQEDITSIEATQLLDKAGNYLRERAQYAQAESLYQQARKIRTRILEQRTRILEQEESDMAETLNDLAKLYYRQGKYTQAEPLYQRALAIRENVLGPEHPNVATSLNDLARLYYSQGKNMLAEPLCQRALAIREKILGPEHPDVANSLNDLARLYYSQGKYAQAESLYQRALAIRENILGSEHPEVAETLNNLGRLYYRQGNYTQAEVLCRHALAIRERALGPEHPAVANSLNNLARLHYRQGRYTQAELLYPRAQAMGSNILEPEPEHPDIATILNYLAGLYYSQGKYTQAEPHYLLLRCAGQI